MQDAPDTQPASAVEAVARPGGFPGERRFVATLALTAVVAGALVAWRACSGPAWLIGYAMGLPLVGYGLALLRRYRVARCWPQMAATVEGAFVEEVSAVVEETESGRNYRPLVRYRYEFDGRAFRGDRFSPDANGRTRASWDAAREFAHAYRRGAIVTARVCPADPAWAVLRVDLPAGRLSHACAWLVLGGGLMACSVWLAQRCI